MAGQQQEEIETIRSRTIEVKLSDADVKRISEKAAAHGLTVGELIENFIGDLVCGTYSNGSDERMYAEQWFERCWFGMFPDLTFLRYLIEWGGLDEVIGAWENIKSTEENIQTSEEALASGVMKGRGGRTYTWKDLTNGKGTPCYSSTFSHISLSMMGAWAFSIYARLSFAVGMRFLLLKPSLVDLKLSVMPIYATFSRMAATADVSQQYGSSDTFATPIPFDAL